MHQLYIVFGFPIYLYHTSEACDLLLLFHIIHHFLDQKKIKSKHVSLDLNKQYFNKNQSSTQQITLQNRE